MVQITGYLDIAGDTKVYLYKYLGKYGTNNSIFRHSFRQKEYLSKNLGKYGTNNSIFKHSFRHKEYLAKYLGKAW